MDEKQTLKQWIDESDNIVFLAELGYLQKVGYQTSEVKTDYITSNMIIHQKLLSVIVFITRTQKSFFGFIKIR